MPLLRVLPPPRKRGSTSQLLSAISGALLILGLVVIILYASATPGRPIRYIGVGILTAIAALVTGCLLGFLFGIPRVVSSGELRLNKDAPTEVVQTQTSDTTVTTATIPPSSALATAVSAASEQPPPEIGNGDPHGGGDAGPTGARKPPSPFEPSTNLSEVSDWLTKLLLGAGLVELTHLGKPLGRLINAVALGMGQTTAGSRPDSTAQVMGGSLLITYFVLGFLDGYVVTTLWYGSKVRHI
jgi:hypothetical protein